MATLQERDLFATQLLLLVGRNCMRLPPNEKITGFLSMSGHDYNNELMVIGRAVNGWDDGI